MAPKHPGQPELPVSRLRRMVFEVAPDPARPCRLIDDQRMAVSEAVARGRDDTENALPPGERQGSGRQHEGHRQPRPPLRARQGLPGLVPRGQGASARFLREPGPPGLDLSLSRSEADEVRMTGQLAPDGGRCHLPRRDQFAEHRITPCARGSETP